MRWTTGPALFYARKNSVLCLVDGGTSGLIWLGRRGSVRLLLALLGGVNFRRCWIGGIDILAGFDGS